MSEHGSLHMQTSELGCLNSNDVLVSGLKRIERASGAERLAV